jgi:hypothetical protein
MNDVTFRDLPGHFTCALSAADVTPKFGNLMAARFLANFAAQFGGTVLQIHKLGATCM